MVDVVSVGDKVSVTSAIHNGFRFISYNDRGRWISNKYLSDKKPAVSPPGAAQQRRWHLVRLLLQELLDRVGPGPERDQGVPGALCALPAGQLVRRPPAGYSGFHGTGRALDVMISNSSVGWDIANWTRANAGKLGVSEVIYYQKIWTVERSSEGWRPMSDRGSASANHYDHVHVSVY